MDSPALIPLSELDRFFFALELLGHPPMARISFELSREGVDVALLRQAFEDTIRRFPVLNACIVEKISPLSWHAGWQPRRTVEPEKAVMLHDFSALPPEQALQTFHRLQFDRFDGYDSRTCTPFRAAVCLLPEGRCCLLFFFHHAATDAYGYSLYLHDLFVTYNRLAGTAVTAQDCCLPPVFPPAPLLPAGLGGKCAGLVQALLLMLRHAARRRGRASVKLFSRQPCFSGSLSAVQRSIGPDHLRRHLAAARQLDCTFTEFFAAAHAVALQRWKQQRCEAAGPISIQVHADIRKQPGEFREIANKFSVMLLTAGARDLDNAHALAQSLHRQTRRAYARKEPEKIICAAWLLNLRLARTRLAWWGPQLLARPGLGDSFQISNAGRLWADPGGRTRLTRLGRAELTGCFMSGPPIPAMGCYTGMCTFRDQLFVSFNYFTWALTGAEAEAFADLLLQILDEMSFRGAPP